MGEYFGRDMDPTVVYKWVRDLSKKADEVLRPMKVDTGRVWVADEVVVREWRGGGRTTRPSQSRRMGWHRTGM